LAQTAGAALVVPDMAQAVEQALALLMDAAGLQNAHTAAGRLALAHRGAAQRTALEVRDWLAG